MGTRTFVNNDFDFLTDGIVGFSRDGELGSDLFDGPTKADSRPVDMLSAIGPFLEMADCFSGHPIVTTTGGVLIFDDESMLVTFQAIVPEPASISLVLAASDRVHADSPPKLRLTRRFRTPLFRTATDISF